MVVKLVPRKIPSTRHIAINTIWPNEVILEVKNAIKQTISYEVTSAKLYTMYFARFPPFF